MGSRFRDWASVTQQPAQTDRSLELKFKQVRFSFFSQVQCGAGYSQSSHSSSKQGSRLGMGFAHLTSITRMRSTIGSRQRSLAGTSRMKKLSRSTMAMTQMMKCLILSTTLRMLIKTVPLARSPPVGSAPPVQSHHSSAKGLHANPPTEAPTFSKFFPRPSIPRSSPAVMLTVLP